MVVVEFGLCFLREILRFPSFSAKNSLRDSVTTRQRSFSVSSYLLLPFLPAAFLINAVLHVTSEACVGRA